MLRASGSLTNGGGITLGTSSNLAVTGAYTQTVSGALTLLIGGTPASGEFGTLTANGVNIAGTFTGHLVNEFSANPGDQYPFIVNTGTSAVSGTFSGLPEASPVFLDGEQFTITYSAGAAGNNVALNAAHASVPTHLVFLQQPTGAQTHAVLAPVTVAVEDASDLIVASDSSLVTIAVNFGTNTLKTVSAHAVNGIATFNTLSIGASKVYTLVASDAELMPAQSVSFAVSPGPVVALSFQQQPSAVITGVAISPAVSIRATDSLGNFIANAPITVTVASGPGALAGPVMGTTNSGGLAVFSGLILGTPGTYTLVAMDGAVQLRRLRAVHGQPAARPQRRFHRNDPDLGRARGHHRSGTADYRCRFYRGGH